VESQTPRSPASPSRRRSVAKLLIVLGAAGVAVNAVLLVTGEGSNAPQVVNLVLGGVIAIFGVAALRSAKP
jgi:hypothetical protein